MYGSEDRMLIKYNNGNLTDISLSIVDDIR